MVECVLEKDNIWLIKMASNQLFSIADKRKHVQKGFPCFLLHLYFWGRAYTVASSSGLFLYNEIPLSIEIAFNFLPISYWFLFNFSKQFCVQLRNNNNKFSEKVLCFSNRRLHLNAWKRKLSSDVTFPMAVMKYFLQSVGGCAPWVCLLVKA